MAEAIDAEAEDLNLDETQRRQLTENIKKAERDLREVVWRSYHYVFLLGKDNALQQVDLGYVTSSSANSPITNITEELTRRGEFDKNVSVRLLLKNWPGAFIEWPTKSVRDAIYASPQFPRIENGTEAVQNAIANGVSRGELAYVGKTATGGYKPFHFNTGLAASEVEIVDEMFIITRETADAYLKKRETLETQPEPPQPGVEGKSPVQVEPQPETPPPGPAPSTLSFLKWAGEVPPQKWMNFYTKVLSRFVTGSGLKVTVQVEVAPEGGVSKQKADEARSALRELGLNDNLKSE